MRYNLCDAGRHKIRLQGKKPYLFVHERVSDTHINSVQLKLSLLTSMCVVVCLPPHIYSIKCLKVALGDMVSLLFCALERSGKSFRVVGNIEGQTTSPKGRSTATVLFLLETSMPAAFIQSLLFRIFNGQMPSYPLPILSVC